MEKHPVLGARLLALLLAAAVAGAWALEERSPVSAALRDDRPVIAAVSFSSGNESKKSFLLVFQPVSKTLDLVLLPPPSGPKISPLPTLPAPSARFDWPALDGDPGETPLAGRRWLIERLRGPVFWREASSLAAPWNEPAAVDRVLLLLELAALSPESFRAAWLPEGAAAGPYLARLLAPPAKKSAGRPVSAEVLNASGTKGIASDATKVLRSGGLDVVYYGNAPVSQAKTVVYDRRGDIENAIAARRALSCASAEAATRVDSKSLADVSIILGSDCSWKR